MTNSVILKGVHLHYAATAFRDPSLKSLLMAAVSRKPGTRRQDIHALKDISINIQAGERLALLGPNGAGKSTLLRAIAGVYPVSSGSRVVKGSIRSIFEIGLGFEPNATGRENILYRGLLLGLTPKFMRSMEEDIITFAELGEFIDYPVKTYSAGMLVRLAFSISTAVGGDILLLDEVIGAGDAKFMIKARQRIKELVERSEVLLLASHDMNTLAATCNRGVVLDRGEVRFDGPIQGAIEAYKKLNGIST